MAHLNLPWRFGWADLRQPFPPAGQNSLSRTAPRVRLSFCRLHRQTAVCRHIQEIQQEMIGLLQRVSHAEVTVGGKTIGQISRGLVVLVAVHRDDTDKDVTRLAERLLGYRVFADDEGRMNRSVRDISGGLLLVPQFTLTADTK